MKRKLYQHLASRIDAWDTCIKRGNHEWEHEHLAVIEALVKRYLPSGSGFDNGTTWSPSKSNDERLTFITSFHHMDDAGGYDGWTDHEVVVTPSLIFGINIRVTGRNRNDIKDYIDEAFDVALMQEIDDTEALAA